jgi:hypothetical protein
MNYKRKSQNQWQWQGRNKTYHVRIFPQQGTLIWGAWMQGGEGVVFDEGSKQTYAQFQADGVPPSHQKHLPDGLMDELRDAVEQLSQPQTTWFQRIFKRGKA